MTTIAQNDGPTQGYKPRTSISPQDEVKEEHRDLESITDTLNHRMPGNHVKREREGRQREYRQEVNFGSLDSLNNQLSFNEQTRVLRLMILRLFESYFRHRWLNLLPIILMLIVAGAYGAIDYLSPTYTARGAFYVQTQPLVASLTTGQQDAFSWITPADQTIGNIRELLQTEAFTRAVIEKTDLQAASPQGKSFDKLLDEARRSIKLYAIGRNLIGISCNHEQSQVAQQISDSIIETFIRWKIDAKLQESTVAEGFLNETVQAYQRDLDTAREGLKIFYVANPDPPQGNRPSTQRLQIDILQDNIDLASKRLLDAQNKAESARLLASVAESNVRQQYQVIDTAILPDQPERSWRKLVISSVVFIVAGIFLSSVIVIGGALLDRTCQVPLDVRRGLNLKVLAIVPEIEVKKKPKTGTSGENV
jgi:capsular polysaccharide biosynthesis protein